MPGGLSLGQLVVRGRVADKKDGNGGQANVGYHVLIVTGLSPNLETLYQTKTSTELGLT